VLLLLLVPLLLQLLPRVLLEVQPTQHPVIELKDSKLSQQESASIPIEDQEHLEDGRILINSYPERQLAVVEDERLLHPDAPAAVRDKLVGACGPPVPPPTPRDEIGPRAVGIL
jgi:hypothetical protein